MCEASGPSCGESHPLWYKATIPDGSGGTHKSGFGLVCNVNHFANYFFLLKSDIYVFIINNSSICKRWSLEKWHLSKKKKEKKIPPLVCSKQADVGHTDTQHVVALWIPALLVSIVMKRKNHTGPNGIYMVVSLSLACTFMRFSLNITQAANIHMHRALTHLSVSFCLCKTFRVSISWNSE